MSFANLKRNKGNFAELKEKMKAEQNQNSYQDDRIWNLTVDDHGNGSAVIRFLPPVEGESLPYAMRYSHGFKDPKTGKWFIENCPSTIGQPCPVCEANGVLWNTGDEANKNIARSRRRQTSYYANVYIVNDPAKPENNGKVFIYRFGVKIFEMIMDQIEPKFDDQTPCNVFDFWEGANFNLRAYNNQARQRSYDKSSFASPSQLLPTDEEMEAVYNQQYKLQEFLAPTEFKTYEDLSKRFAIVTGQGYNEPKKEDEEDTQASPPGHQKFGGPVPNNDVETDDDLPWNSKEPEQESASDDDDGLNYYRTMLGKK